MCLVFSLGRSRFQLVDQHGTYKGQMSGNGNRLVAAVAKLIALNTLLLELPYSMINVHPPLF